jgi:2-polyprenyl-6-methoxyphenol hydroxylase-like FAD-dependent oxidoreductase
MRVAVIGAGIGGLVTAIGLQRAGADVTVFERAPGPRPSGSGLSLWGNAFTALDAVGLDLRPLGAPQWNLTAGQRRPDGRWLSVIPAATVRELRVVHRADLHRALAQALKPGTVRYSVDIPPAADPLAGRASDEQPAGDAPTGCDVVVAADGLRSLTRASWPGDPGVRYSGYSTWRGVTAHAVDLGGGAGETLGDGLRFGLAPMADGRVYWFAVATMPAGTVLPDEYGEVRRRFATWHAPIPEVIAATPPEVVFRLDIHDLNGPVPTFRRGRTVLLGDAAHAMTPDLGQGAGQAMEDAATLTRLLEPYAGSPHPDPAAIDRALNTYDGLRRARTQPIAARARKLGTFVQSGGRLRNAVLRLTPPAVIARQLRTLQSWTPPPAGASASGQSRP